MCPSTAFAWEAGGARSALWRQIQADVYGHAVERVQAEEGAAYGAAILAGVGAGNWHSVEEACDAVVQTAEKIQPDADQLGNPRGSLPYLPSDLSGASEHFQPCRRGLSRRSHRVGLCLRETPMVLKRT